MNEQMMAAMSDELAQIKQAGWGGVLSGVGKFLRGGAKGFSQLGSQAGRVGLMTAAKGLPGRLGTAWQHGGIGGVGRTLARSQPVQMATLGAGGLYAGSKALRMLRGRQPQQQPQQ